MAKLYTPDQIALCKQLYEQLEVKREPKVGEWWRVFESNPKLLLNIVPCGTVKSFCDGWDGKFNSTFTIDKLLHPLYSCEELLEILIKNLDCNEIIQIDHNHVGLVDEQEVNYLEENDNILTALLKLAVEVTKGESK